MRKTKLSNRFNELRKHAEGSSVTLNTISAAENIWNKLKKYIKHEPYLYILNDTTAYFEWEDVDLELAHPDTLIIYFWADNKDTFKKYTIGQWKEVAKVINANI